MAIPYPDWLPLAQKANKNRSSDVGFRTDQPAVGAPIYQKLTDDLKTTWTLTWLFQRSEDRAFEQWLRSPRYLDNGNQWFTMPINLGGSGVQIQELHFTADGYPKQTSDNNGVITWSATVISRGVINSDDDDSDIIVELPPIWWGWLDEIVNRDLPEYVIAPVVPEITPINLAMVALDGRVNFTRAGAASYIGSDGLLKQAAANQWPLEYLAGVGRTEPEPAGSNLFIQSNSFSASAWIKPGNQITVTYGFTSPDGLNNASKINRVASMAAHSFNQVLPEAIPTGSQLAISVFAKAAEVNVLQFLFSGGATGISSAYMNFDLNSGLVNNSGGLSAYMVPLGNGWYRCVVIIATTGDTSVGKGCYFSLVNTINDSRNLSTTGLGTDGLYMFGAQLELNTAPTSYIATTTAPATRPAATATIPANGATGIKITYSTGETTNLSFGTASAITIPAATKAWGTRYITLIEYLP